MGDPKKPKKKYESTRFPWRSDILERELRSLGKYGLRNKRELWRHRTMLSKFRSTARSLLSKTTFERAKIEAEAQKKDKRHSEEIARINTEKAQAIAHVKAETAETIAKIEQELRAMGIGKIKINEKQPIKEIVLEKVDKFVKDRNKIF